MTEIVTQSSSENETGLYIAGKIWEFETDIIANGTGDIKHIHKIQIIIESKDKARFRIYALYDGKEYASRQNMVYDSGTLTEGKKVIRIKPRKTANFGYKLRFEGTGYVKFYGLEIFTVKGGNLYTES